MHCLNCNSKIADGEEFCNVCGSAIDTQPLKKKRESKVVKEETTDVSTFINDENEEQENAKMLMKAYIGKNYEKIIKKDFSWNAFLFGPFYFFYRKMWLVAAIWFVVVFVGILFLPSIFMMLNFALSIFVALKFNTWYVERAGNDIGMIKEMNRGKTQNELERICRNKGGTSIIIPILLIIGCFFVASVLFYLITTYIDEVLGEYSDISSYQSAYSTSNQFDGCFSSVPYPVLDNTWIEVTNNKLKDYSVGNDKAYSLSMHFKNNDTIEIDNKFEQYKKDLENTGYSLYEVQYNHYTYVKDDIAVVIFAGYDYLSVELSSGYLAPHNI